MTYSKANRMATATVSGTTSTHTYDAFGIREEVKTGSSPTQIMQYDQDGNLLTETNTSGTETDYAYMDGVPIAAIQPGAATISALLTDHLGTPQIGTDSIKATVWTGVYDPNGAVNPTGSITQNLRFPGQRANSTGLNYNMIRYYNPAYVTGGGRYNQVDPLGLWAGSNPFVYGLNNPFKYVDPWGLAPGGHYSTADQAALAGMQDIYDKSMQTGNEYAGRVYQITNGFGPWSSTYYSYTAPNMGTPVSSRPGDCPKDTENRGYYHTHPRVPGYNSEEFSPADKVGSDIENQPAYVATAGGKELKFVPSSTQYGPGTGTTSTLNTNLPIPLPKTTSGNLPSM